MVGVLRHMVWKESAVAAANNNDQDGAAAAAAAAVKAEGARAFEVWGGGGNSLCLMCLFFVCLCVRYFTLRCTDI